MGINRLLSLLIEINKVLEYAIQKLTKAIELGKSLKGTDDYRMEDLDVYQESVQNLQALLNTNRKEVEKLRACYKKQQSLRKADSSYVMGCPMPSQMPSPMPSQMPSPPMPIENRSRQDRARLGSSADAASGGAVPPAAPSRAEPSAPHAGRAENQDGPKPEVDLKKVQFSAVAPKTFVKGEYTIIDIIMYEERFRHVVDELLRGADVPVKEAKSGIVQVSDRSTIRIELTSPDLEIEDHEETRQWQGGYLDFSFAVFLPEQYRKNQILFNAHVYVNDLIAAKLKFVAACTSPRQQKLSVSREDILSAFVSYASQDRNRVAAIIQGMKKARPDMDIFFDVDSLRSGDDWESALYREIERRDILFLCWSHFARQSKWVNEEWRYALAHKGIECIEPVPIEPPNICPPPEELSKKHFNDKLLYIIQAEGGA